MQPKRIIPCLDVKDGRVVKGVQFTDLVDAGDPVECAIAYEKQGADELVFLDITATTENRDTVIEMVRKVAAAITIPLAVGGGIRTVEDFEAVLGAGASKAAANSAAVARPQLIREAADSFGSSAVVAAIDVMEHEGGKYTVLTNGGNSDTGIDAIEWAKQVASLGAGEILLTSLSQDGKKTGYDLEITKQVRRAANIPVTASGGAGSLEDFYLAFTEGEADAALSASLFHFNELTVRQVKEYLRSQNINIIP
ncbi:MAG: imidazole glycerol phosphate synthase subunit HisF [Eubacteriaceae bacterium]|nr:imidazole glycerol phosphate synthase subunit HisF [Eubacteriaceae bacterium]